MGDGGVYIGCSGGWWYRVQQLWGMEEKKGGAVGDGGINGGSRGGWSIKRVKWGRVEYTQGAAGAGRE